MAEEETSFRLKNKKWCSSFSDLMTLLAKNNIFEQNNNSDFTNRKVIVCDTPNAWDRNWCLSFQMKICLFSNEPYDGQIYKLRNRLTKTETSEKQNRKMMSRHIKRTFGKLEVSVLYGPWPRERNITNVRLMRLNMIFTMLLLWCFCFCHITSLADDFNDCPSQLPKRNLKKTG